MQPERTDTSLASLAGSGPRVCATPLPRRTVLRAAGVSLALPWLEAMAHARNRDALPTRVVWVYAPNGVKLDEWRVGVPIDGEDPHPIAGTYELRALPPLLESLAPHRQRTQILRGLTHDKARSHGDGPGDHARAAATYLTGVQPLKTEGRVRLGISADQLAARHIGDATRVRSLTLGIENNQQAGQCDSGYACAYSSNISWESETIPAAKEIDPRRAFDRLFRGGDASTAAETRLARLASRRSLLDFVREDSQRLSRRLGSEDRARIDEYESGVRELERRLRFDAVAHEARVGDEERPGGLPPTFREHAELMGRVLALALRTDTARIATFLLANEASRRRYTEVDAHEGHHSLSHHGGDPEKLAVIGRINRLHVGAFAELIAQLLSQPEGDGSVFDRTILTFGSGIAEGDRHDHHDLPVVLVSGSKTGFAGDRTLVTPRETPMNDLHLALMERVGVPGVADGHVTLGDGRAPLAGL